ncbi:MAG: hypothetical protein ABIH79_00290 [archaeon]
MTILDRVIEMQNQGLSETQITTQLQNEGRSPNEINESLNQLKIKNAVSPPEQIVQAPTYEIYPPKGQRQQPIRQSPQQTAPMTSPEQMTQELGTQEMQSFQAPQSYPPQRQQQQPQDDYYTQTPQAYSPQDYYAPQNALDIETISEIAEQVVIEKLEEFKKKTGDLVSFRNSIQNQVTDIDERLKRIENSIDKMQQAIIGKIGEFGESNAIIHQDLDNLHGTVAKLMNPLIDNYKELKKLSK